MTRIIPRELIRHLEWVPGQEPPKPSEPEPTPPAVEQRIFSIDSLVSEGKPFYSDEKKDKKDIGVAVSLKQAMEYAGTDGVVASMPYLIAGKAQANKEENYLWKDWFTALTEENAGTDKKGTLTKAGEPVVITVHGRGILTPERIMKAYEEGLTPQNAAKYTQEEFENLLKGTLPNGKSINLYTIDDVKKGKIPEPFGNYAVWMPADTAKNTNSGYHKKKEFIENPLVIARAGTLEHLDSYFEKAKHTGDKDVRNSHRLAEIDFNIYQGRVLFLNSSFNGLNGYLILDYDGRFVGVAPEAHP